MFNLHVDSFGWSTLIGSVHFFFHNCILLNDQKKFALLFLLPSAFSVWLIHIFISFIYNYDLFQLNLFCFWSGMLRLTFHLVLSTCMVFDFNLTEIHATRNIDIFRIRCCKNCLAIVPWMISRMNAITSKSQIWRVDEYTQWTQRNKNMYILVIEENERKELDLITDITSFKELF